MTYYQRLPPSQRNKFVPASSNFPINSLAPSNDQPNPGSHAYNPPTPPRDVDDSDLMDWTPSQETFVPAPTKNLPHNLPLAQPVPARPFFTKVPRQPESQNALIRKPPRQPHFKSAPEEKKRGFFNRLTNSAASPSTIGSKYVEGQAREYPEMARQKFYAQTEVQDTGLESLFDAAFSLGDDPAEMRSSEAPSEFGRLSITQITMARGLGRIGAFLLAGVILKLPSYRPSLTPQLQFLALGITGVVSTQSLLHVLQEKSSIFSVVWEGIKITVCAVTATLAVSHKGDLVQEAIHLLSAILISGMLFQETWNFLSATEPSTQKNDKAPPFSTSSKFRRSSPQSRRHQQMQKGSSSASQSQRRNANGAFSGLDQELFQPSSRNLIPVSADSSPEFGAQSPAPSMSSWGSPDRTFSRNQYAGATPGRPGTRHRAGASEGFAALRI